ncbi:MAG: hypothetical protein ACT4QF_14800 [Sporichthyaceae bacterium]
MTYEPLQRPAVVEVPVRGRRPWQAPETGWSTYAGPPALSLDRREVLLRRLRELLAEHDLTPMQAFGGWRYRLVAEGPAASVLLEQAERTATAKRHWWGYDVLWRGADGRAVLAGADPDGNDVHFLAWGPGAREILEGVADLLAAHAPATLEPRDQPVFVQDSGGDVLVFADLSAAEGDLEGVDVEDGEYPRLYAVDGHRVVVATDGQAVRLTVTDELDREGLVTMLREYQARVPMSSPADRPFAVANELLAWESRLKWRRRIRFRRGILRTRGV